MKEKEPNWMSFLIAMVESNYYVIKIKKERFKDPILLNKKIKLNKFNLKNLVELEYMLDSMVDLGYFEPVIIVGNISYNSWKLTPKGIEVALKLQEHKDNKRRWQQQEKYTASIGFLTFILALSATIPISRFIIETFGVENMWLKIFVMLFLMLTIYFPVRLLLK